MLREQAVPMALKEQDSWVLWRSITRSGEPTKVPYSGTNQCASSTQSSTWGSFESVAKQYRGGGFDGVGYVFSGNDPFVGIDLDGCRDPGSGKIATWAKEEILGMNTYSEVSPSQTGIKMWMRGKSPFVKGRKIILDQKSVSNKNPGIEVYDQGRYFATTGHRLGGVSPNPEERQDKLNELCERLFAVDEGVSQADAVARARRYLQRLPAAISGSGGNSWTFRVACILVLGFDLPKHISHGLLQEWNVCCQPQWSPEELQQKIDCADRQPGERGYIRNSPPEGWDQIIVPTYDLPQSGPKIVTLTQAATNYLDDLEHGRNKIISTGLAPLDRALGGGVEKGEMVIFGARPSHGKSAIALQMVHHWTSEGMPAVIVSAEMSSGLLGKRTLQYTSEESQDHWEGQIGALRGDLEAYKDSHAETYVVEECTHIKDVVEQITLTVKDHAVEVAVVDYCQLLEADGGSNYDKVTQISKALKRCAKDNNIVVLALAQLSRAVEHRDKFMPVMSDLKESGQLEQDADVIVFLAWPWLLDSSVNKENYLFIIGKLRNREKGDQAVMCRFLAGRQKVVDPNAVEPVTADAWDPEGCF